MVFPHADDPAPALVDDHVGIPDIGLRRDRAGFTSRFLPVHPLISKVAKINHATGNSESPSSVFVHPGTHVERRWRHVNGLALEIHAHQHISAGLRRTGLDPIDVIAVQGNLAQSDGLGDDQIGGYRRFPRTVWGSLRHLSSGM